MRTPSFYRFFVRLALFPAIAVGVLGCAVKERTNPLPQTYLEGMDVSVVDDTLPFKHAWIDPNLPEEQYTNVWFRTVTADTLPEEAWLASKGTLLSKESEFKKLADELANYFKQELIEKVANFKDGVMSVVDSPHPRGLIFDVALTELEFSHPIQKAGFMLVPIPASSLVFNTVSDPHVAFAAKVYDAQSGKLIATFADRRFPPSRLLDVNRLTLTSSAREICDTWADIIAEGLNRERFADVPDRGFFALLPW